MPAKRSHGAAETTARQYVLEAQNYATIGRRRQAEIIHLVTAKLLQPTVQLSPIG